jgi:hypothetical protein
MLAADAVKAISSVVAIHIGLFMKFLLGFI